MPDQLTAQMQALQTQIAGMNGNRGSTIGWRENRAKQDKLIAQYQTLAAQHGAALVRGELRQVLVLLGVRLLGARFRVGCRIGGRRRSSGRGIRRI